MSTLVNTVPPYVFEQKGTFPAPFTFDVPASLEVRPDVATAKYDGTGAGGPFLACLTFYGSDGERLCRMFNSRILQPGDVAEVTFIPPFGSAADSDESEEIHWGSNTDDQGIGLTLITPSSIHEDVGGSEFFNITGSQFFNIGGSWFVDVTNAADINARSIGLDAGTNIVLQANLGGGGGNIFLNLPLADPGISGALWNNGGIVTVSP